MARVVVKRDLHQIQENRHYRSPLGLGAGPWHLALAISLISIFGLVP